MRGNLGSVAIAFGFAAAALTGCGQVGPRGAAIDGSGQQSGIVNGTEVKDGDPVLKSTVGIYMKTSKGSGRCTGTLLSDKVVLTAAHCVPEDVEQMLIVFTRNFDDLDETTARAALTAVRNPLWGKKDASGRGDIALVLFEGGVPSGFGGAEMIPESVELKPGQDVIVTGYGVSEPATHGGVGVLRRTTLKLVTSASPTEVVTDSHDRSVCFGDSGGPSYIEADGHLYLWGVASAVSKSTCNEWSIHTDITSYEPWIAKIMTKLTESAPQIEANAHAAAKATKPAPAKETAPADRTPVAFSVLSA